MGLTMPDPDVVYDNIQTVHEHEAHDDFWKAIELTNEDYKNMRGYSTCNCSDFCNIA